MDKVLRSQLGMFSDPKYRKHLRSIKRGVEREALRVGADGRPSQLSHPEALGSALTHSMVTTDFSEALLEFITPPCESVTELMQHLNDTHHCAISALPKDEYLWAGSMPCLLDQEDSIPIAQYGKSNTGLMKTVYRRGLAKRYGRYMQSISGIHYNFSMPTQFWSDYARAKGAKAGPMFATESYLGLIRNCRKDVWLLAYLFGATPIAPKGFKHAQKYYSIAPNASGDYEMPYATTLRLSKMGYQSIIQNNIRVRTNSLSEYIADLCSAILDDYPQYAAMGLKADKEYVQLGTGVLQIENEYYGVIRPKQITPKGMPPLKALQQRGIAYIELRCLDSDPRHVLGLDYNTVYFLDTFLLRCLLRDSPLLSAEDERCALERLSLTVEGGRNPSLLLQDDGTQRSVRDWGEALLEECCAVAEVLDADQEGTPHLDACRAQGGKLQDPEKTPSAWLINNMKKERATHFEYISERSLHHTSALSSAHVAQKTKDKFTHECALSVRRKNKLEQEQHTQDFSAYRNNYYQGYYDACMQSKRMALKAHAI